MINPEILLLQIFIVGKTDQDPCCTINQLKENWFSAPEKKLDITNKNNPSRP